MIDFYRKSILSQLGKDAGNQSIPEYIRNISSKYDEYLAKIIEQKLKCANNTEFSIGKIKEVDSQIRKLSNSGTNQGELI